MNNAPIKSLAEVAESVRYGYTASAVDEPVGPHFLRITDIVPSHIDWDRVPFCDIREQDRERFGLKAGDIVIARTGATTGYAKLIRDDPESVFASYLVRVRVDPRYANPGYVGRLVESRMYKRFVGSQIGGAAQPNASAKRLTAFRFPVPDFDTQQRVVDSLKLYDDLIENNRRRIQLLEESARLLYREWFVHLRFPGHEHVRIVDGVPEGWSKVSVNDLVKTQYGYTESASKDPIGPKFLRGTDINKSAYIDWSAVPYCSCSDHDLRKYRLEVGDLVVIRMADPGKVAIIEKDVEAVFASYLIRLSIVGDIKPYYFFYTLREGGYQEYMGGAATGSTRKSASAKVLTDYDVLVPSSSLMSEFEEYVRVIRRQINCLLDQNAALARARDLLLPRLMNGEIAV